MHLLVSELRRFQNARCNDKQIVHRFGHSHVYITRCTVPKIYNTKYLFWIAHTDWRDATY